MSSTNVEQVKRLNESEWVDECTRDHKKKFREKKREILYGVEHNT